MDRFLQAYLVCALWSSTDDGEPIDSSYDIDDLSPEALATMTEECRQFQEDNKADLEQAGDEEQNGHDFWLTRNGHGAGFWDRGYKNGIGKRLTDAARAWGTSDIYVGGDGKLYVT